MQFFDKVLSWILAKLNMLGAVCLVGMMLLTCVDVVGRFFSHPVFGSVELVGFMATMTVAFALPYTHQEKGHIGVELLVQTLSPKTQRLIDAGTGILSLGLFGLVTWRMIVYAQTMQKSGEVSMNLELPEYIIIYMVAFCFFIFTLSLFRDIIKNLTLLKE